MIFKKILVVSLLTFSAQLYSETFYYTLDKKTTESVVVKPYDSPTINEPVGGVCFVKFNNLIKYGSLGAVLASFSIKTESGNYDFGERVFNNPLHGEFENGNVKVENRWNNGIQYQAAQIIDVQAGEWGLYLGNGSSSTVIIELYNPTEIESISYSDYWYDPWDSIDRGSKNYTIEYIDCNDNVVKSKYIDGRLGVSSLVPIEVIL